MSSKDFGLGPKWWQVPGNKLKKCSERKSDSCDPTETDGCCAIIPCTYCLEFEIYGQNTQYGIAEFSATGWSGTVGGYSFVAFWERGYYSEVCEFVVIFDGEEVYRKTCYEGPKCRDASDEVGVTVGYPNPEDGILRWAKLEPLSLPYRIDEYTGCKTWFCGECECTCECLCVEIVNSYGFPAARGEICASGYECEAPFWSGSVGAYEISVGLSRDIYGDCVLTGSVDGQDIGEVPVSGCKNLSAVIVLDDGTEITLACKVCFCDRGSCSEGCCVPYHIEPLYPDGVLDPIPFCVTSSCLDLDGECGVFTPLDPTSSARGTCGFCATYIAEWVGLIPGEFPTFLEDPAHPGQCKMSPCSVAVCMVLECNRDADAIAGQNACSSKMRLWLGTSVPQVDDVGDKPGYEAAGCAYWKEISPTMSECAEEGAGFLAEFPVSFSVVCSKVVGGICDGKDNCCQVACSFAVVI